MSQKDPALTLLTQIVKDLNEGHFIAQVIAVVVTLLVASFVSRWWRARQEEGGGRLKQAGSRLAFPVCGFVLSGIAYLALKPFFHVNLLKLAMPLLASMALVRLVIFVLRQVFPKANWLTTWERIIAALIWGWMALYITDLAPIVIEALESVALPLGKQRLDLWTVVHGVFTVVVTVIVALWIAGILEARLMGVASIDSSLRIVGVRVAKALLTLLAIVTSLSLVGIDMTALSVFTGALGVGLGLGLQKIASNYVSGFIILLDRSIRIGNVVQIGADAGSVTEITTRYTVLRHPGGTEFIVPNETLIASVVQNQTFSDSRLRLVTSVGVAYDCDVELAMRLMNQAAAAQPRVLVDPGPKVFLTMFADSSINLELGFWISDPEEGRGNVISDINLSIWKLFREHGVEIPFPQRDVRIIRDSEAD